MSSLPTDIRLSWRRLWRQPGVAIATFLPLAFAIGANVTLFCVIQEVVLIPRSLLNSDKVYVLWETSTQRGKLMSEISYPDFLDWRATSKTFADMAAMGSINWAHRWTGGDTPCSVPYRSASWSFFNVLGVNPLLGRTFLPEDDSPGAARVVVLSHRFWQGQLGGEQDVIGKSLLLGPRGDEPYTVIGVMPPEFRVPYGAELWTPLGRDMSGFGARSGFDPLEARGLGILFVVARLKNGVSTDMAKADVTRIVRGLSREVHQRRQWDRWGVELTRLDEFELGTTRLGLLALGGAAIALLLLTCLCVGGLLLVRSLSRRREFSIRRALGGSPRLVTQEALVESSILVLLAGVGGSLLAHVATPLALANLPRAIPDPSGLSLDVAIALFVVTVCILTAFLVTLPTAATLREPRLALELSSGRASAAPLRRWQKRLVVAEAAIAMVLVTAAGLLSRSYVELSRADLGFVPDQVLSFQVSPPDGTTNTARRLFYEDLVERIKLLDGVVAAAAVRNRPLLHGAVGDDWNFIYEGQTLSEKDSNPTVNSVVVSADYFRVMGIRLLVGRSFDQQDKASSTPTAIISESLARYAWPRDTLENVLGKRLWINGKNEQGELRWQRIVGIVADSRYRGLATSRLDLYHSAAQAGSMPNGVVVRTRSDPYALSPAVREQVRAMDPTLPVEKMTSMRDAVSSAIAPWRINMQLSTLFAGFALGLAGLGLFGVMAYSVRQRTREIGIRTAVGATPSDIWMLVTGEGLKLVVFGLISGTAIGLAGSRFIASLLYGVGATDVWSFATASLALLLVGLLAGHLPARRAARISPVVALRHE